MPGEDEPQRITISRAAKKISQFFNLHNLRRIIQIDWRVDFVFERGRRCVYLLIGQKQKSNEFCCKHFCLYNETEKIFKLIFIILNQYQPKNLTMGYNRFVQIGRVARINFGPLEGKIATIVDIVSYKRVLVDGPGIQRQIIPISRLQLTKQVLKVGRGTTSGKLRALVTKQNVQKTFDESSLGRSYARQARREQLTDFERFKALTLRRKLSKLLRARQDKKVAKKK